MNLNYIKYFCDAVRLGSISASSKANFVTLSAVSQGISHLEKSLGVNLVAHHPNRFRLTPTGEEAFKRGCELLRKAEEFESSFSPKIGNLEFASIYSFGLAVIPQHLKQFTTDHPQAKVNFHLANNAQIKEMLKVGAIDFGIVGNDYDLEGYESRTIYTGHFELYAASDFSMEGTKFILAAYDTDENRALKRAYLNEFGSDLPVSLEVTSWEAIANLVSEGAGIGYLPDYMEKKKGALLKRCPLNVNMEPTSYEIRAIYPKGMRLRQSSEIFLAFDHKRLNKK